MSVWAPVVLVGVSLLNALSSAVAVDNRQLDHLNVLQVRDRGNPGPAELERVSATGGSQSRVVDRPEVRATPGRAMVSVGSPPRHAKPYEAAMPPDSQICGFQSRIAPPIHWASVTFNRIFASSCPTPHDLRRETSCASCQRASSDAS